MPHIVTEAQLAAFCAGVQAKVAAHWAKMGYKQAQPVIGYSIGQRYAKIISQEAGSGSVHCFIDLESGAVLKAESWKKPHPKPRGSILGPDGGMDAVNHYGAHYLYR